MDPAQVKLIRIPDTLHITAIEISQGFLAQAKATTGLEILEGPCEWAFNEAGGLL